MSKLSAWLLLLFISTQLIAKETPQEIYNQLKTSVKIYKQDHKESLLLPILRKYVKLYSLTKSYHSYNLIVDEYKKNPKKFLDYVKRNLTAKEFLIIKYNLESLIREKTKGTDF